MMQYSNNSAPSSKQLLTKIFEETIHDERIPQNRNCKHWYKGPTHSVEKISLE